MRRLALVALTIVLGVSIGQAVAVETDPPGVRVWASVRNDPAVTGPETRICALM